MIRLLIFLALGYLLYRVIRSLVAPRKDGGMERPAPGANLPRRVDDELVQDPVCKTYVPTREAEMRRVDDKVYYFCSRACAERFLEEEAGGQRPKEKG